MVRLSQLPLGALMSVQFRFDVHRNATFPNSNVLGGVRDEI